MMVFLATGCGVGFIPVWLKNTLSGIKAFSVPERWTGAGFLGSLMGLALVPLWVRLDKTFSFLIVAIVTAFAVYSAGRAESILGNKDDSRIIIDEIAGISWVFVWMPFRLMLGPDRIFILLAGFVLFRIFDVFKLPFRKIENVSGGLGIVLDDVLAGILANLILQVSIRLWLEL